VDILGAAEIEGEELEEGEKDPSGLSAQFLEIEI
jgi:hypothetical protein